MTRRSVKTFFGRYMALLLIVAISVGFFAGLKITTDSMLNTGEIYLDGKNFYDYRLFSTLGFTADDVKAFASLDGIERAEGAKSTDVLVDYAGNKKAFTLLSVTEKVNLPSLIAGRMPAEKNECLADSKYYNEEDIGTTVHLSAENGESVKSQIDGTEFVIVGLAESPLYLGIDRGTTDIGNGSVFSFFYLPEQAFLTEAYTEIDLILTGSASLQLYSEEYDRLIREHKSAVTAQCKELADKRYRSMIEESGVTDKTAVMLGYDSATSLLEEQYGLSSPETYILTRNENAGYVSFENDTAIVGGVANIFPVFFILIALLVCITTMTRMVDEERTQIGVLKAMGFSNGKIMTKYLLYAGSATVIGWAIGFFVCTWGLPQIFWFAYSVLYDFAAMPYLFSPSLAIITLAVSLAAILGATFLSCRKELISVPAKLIRPKATKNGKRIFLERITPLWKRLPFLSKIIFRNMLRYKRRLFMMLVGISCCAGLVVTAFGVHDSMIHIGTLQFEEIQKYDMEISFKNGTEDTVKEELNRIDEITEYLTVSSTRVDLHGESTMNSVTLLSFAEAERTSDFWTFAKDGADLAMPRKGEALINTKIADKLNLSVGDTLEIQSSDMQICSAKVSGIYDNYIYNYVVIHPETYTDAFGEWEANTALLSLTGDSEALAERLTEIDEISSVSRLSATKETVDSALSCLNYIIWLVVGFSGALAFIVIFNLTNINIAERSREIATVQVLGFYPKETNSYVLRENLILSVLASILGLPLGTLFHRIVMSMIQIDSFAFHVHVTATSYVLSLICTVFFAMIVNLFMRKQIDKIKMAESLKAVE